MGEIFELLDLEVISVGPECKEGEVSFVMMDPARYRKRSRWQMMVLNDVVLHIQMRRVRENILSNNEAKIIATHVYDFHMQTVIAGILLVASIDRDTLAVEFVTTDGCQGYNQDQQP